MLSHALVLQPLVGLSFAWPSKFSISDVVEDSLVALNSAPVGFSYDFGFDLWWGNVSNTRSCMSNLKELTGQWPVVRLAGGEDDSSVFDPNLSVTRYYTPISGIADSQYFGPLYFTDVLAKYPGPIIFGFNRGAGNLSNTVLAATYAKRDLPNLYKVEFGNEPDLYPYSGASYYGNSSAPMLIVQENGGVDAWTPAVEAATQVQYQLAVGPILNESGIVQCGAYYLPPMYGYSAAYLLSQENSTALQYVGAFSHHFYPQTASPKAVGAAAPNLEQLQSHVNISTNMVPYAQDAAATDSYGLEYVLGETNSVSGGGSADISPTFGAGLWVLDYVLRATSSNVARLNFHFQSYGSSYYIWWDKLSIRSPYYGGYVAAEALAGQSYIAALDNGTTNYAGYAIYSADKKVSKVVFINTDYFDGNGSRSSHDFVLSGVQSKAVTAKRLTAISALSRQDFGDAPTYAGRSFSNSTCSLSGNQKLECVSVSRGQVTFNLKASEALVVIL